VQQAIHKNLKGHTVVIVAHRLSTIENADKIIVLDHGQIVEMGNHRELLKNDGLYAHLVKKQMHSDDENKDAESTATTNAGPATTSLPKTSTPPTPSTTASASASVTANFRYQSNDASNV
jgi:ABC-type multidrug transport system ATPase subunit